MIPEEEDKETTIQHAEATTEHTSIKALTLEESFTTEEVRSNREATTSGYITTTVVPADNDVSTEQQELESTLTPNVEVKELSTDQVQVKSEDAEEPVPVTEKVAELQGEENLVVIVPSVVIPMTNQDEPETTTLAGTKDVEHDTTVAVLPVEHEAEAKEEEEAVTTMAPVGAVEDVEKETEAPLVEDPSEPEADAPVEKEADTTAQPVQAEQEEVTTTEVQEAEKETVAVVEAEATTVVIVKDAEDVVETTTPIAQQPESTQSYLEELLAAQSSG